MRAAYELGFASRIRSSEWRRSESWICANSDLSIIISASQRAASPWAAACSNDKKTFASLFTPSCVQVVLSL